MKKNKKSKSLSALTKEQLIAKCESQRDNIKSLMEKLLTVREQIVFIEKINLAKGRKGAIEKVCIEETMSLFNDVEELKNENKALKKENLELKEKLKKWDLQTEK